MDTKTKNKTTNTDQETDQNQKTETQQPTNQNQDIIETITGIPSLEPQFKGIPYKTTLLLSGEKGSGIQPFTHTSILFQTLQNLNQKNTSQNIDRDRENTGNQQYRERWREIIKNYREDIKKYTPPKNTVYLTLDPIDKATKKLQNTHRKIDKIKEIEDLKIKTTEIENLKNTIEETIENHKKSIIYIDSITPLDLTQKTLYRLKQKTETNKNILYLIEYTNPQQQKRYMFDISIGFEIDHQQDKKQKIHIQHIDRIKEKYIDTTKIKYEITTDQKTDIFKIKTSKTLD